MTARRASSIGSLLALLLVVWALRAQDKAAGNKPAAAPPAQRETVAKPLSEKEKKKQDERLRKELETPYKRWLDEDVSYIISGEEKDAFKRLSTDEERENFIEQFWLRRDPTPDSEENEFKEEHYRRIAYANDRFAAGVMGWRTDRGRIYIMFGPPDQIEDHPSGGTYQRPREEGGGSTSTYPFVQWRYRHIDDIGDDVIVEFVDTCFCGHYRLEMDPTVKDALLNVPGAGLTMYEEMGMSNKEDRFNRSDGTRLGVPEGSMSSKMNPFTRLEQFTKLQQPPAVKFKDLEAVITSRITYNILPMRVRVDYIRVTGSSVLANITLQFDRKDLQFQAKNGVHSAVINIFGSVTSMARRRVNTFEETILSDVPSDLLQEAVRTSAIYQQRIPLAPGMYRLNIVAKDVVGGNLNNYELALHVPRFDEETLASSTVILADVLEKVPTRGIGTGQFVIGTSKVRPRLNETFRQDEKMGVYFQLYNFGADEKTEKPNGSIQYQVTRDGTNQKIFDFTEEVTSVEGASASQVTVEKLLPLQSMEPGKYTLKITVTDRSREKTLTTSANFTVS
jgi:GWxTD domain-containing protein